MAEEKEAAPIVIANVRVTRRGRKEEEQHFSTSLDVLSEIDKIRVFNTITDLLSKIMRKQSLSEFFQYTSILQVQITSFFILLNVEISHSRNIVAIENKTEYCKLKLYYATDRCYL